MQPSTILFVTPGRTLPDNSVSIPTLPLVVFRDSFFKEKMIYVCYVLYSETGSSFLADLLGSATRKIINNLTSGLGSGETVLV